MKKEIKTINGNNFITEVIEKEEVNVLDQVILLHQLESVLK